MGAFSIYREGVDRQSIDLAVEILATGERPLVIFPEGAVFRTNDRLQPLLDGVAFLARTLPRSGPKRMRTRKCNTPGRPSSISSAGTWKRVLDQCYVPSNTA